MISSLQNDKIKLAHALQGMAKARRKEGKIVLEGVRLVRDALLAGHAPLFALTSADFDDASVLQPLRAKGVETLPVSDEVMRHVSETQQPQGILAVFPIPEPILPPVPQRILILDAIRDPGNMGTILRTAGAAGVQAVLLSPTCADPYNPKALRSGMGAHFRVPVMEMDWAGIATYSETLQLYIADSAGDVPYNRADWSKAWGLMIGSEAHGAGDEARSLAHQRVYIPMARSTESLNAAVAAGIILFEAVRQR
jgi:RNA methyltransferase, TrmH family